ncbi:hypothetical protein ES705_22914 [subsurface metagenome]
MLEVIRQDYICTALTKGLPYRTVIYKHALRNALRPIITVFGLQFSVRLEHVVEILDNIVFFKCWVEGKEEEA